MLPANMTGQPQSGVNPVAKVLPVLGIERIGSSTQEQASNAKNFIIGQVYQAKIQEKVDQTTHLVKVDQQLLKMQLGQSAKPGQTLPLRFIQASPVPTFLLDDGVEGLNDQAKISQTGKLIAKFLQQSQGASSRYQAQEVVTQNPMLVAATAQALKQSVSKTGLFYESHLQALAQGEQSVDSLMQEPQNAQRQLLPTLVSQQLSLLETQKFSWSGEIWPGQVMQLDIAPVSDDETPEEAQASHQEEDKPVESTLSLHLPLLGDVAVKLRMDGEQLAVSVQAAEADSRAIMQTQQSRLQTALLGHVKTLSHLSIDHMTEQKEASRHTGYRPVTPG